MNEPNSPRKSATPPPRGIGTLLILRGSGLSTIPSLRLTSRTIGVRTSVSASAAKNTIANGVSRKEITLLSPFKFEKSVASRITKYKIGLCRDDSEEITYSTIQGFKGLENTVIFLTDIQTYNKPDLMYVAMSRPRSMLVIFETKAAEKYRKQNS